MSPQAAGQLSPRGTCLASVGNDKTFCKIKGGVFSKGNMAPGEQGLGLDLLSVDRWLFVDWYFYCKLLFSYVNQSCAEEGGINILMCKLSA